MEYTVFQVLKDGSYDYCFMFETEQNAQKYIDVKMRHNPKARYVIIKN